MTLQEQMEIIDKIAKLKRNLSYAHGHDVIAAGILVEQIARYVALLENKKK